MDDQKKIVGVSPEGSIVAFEIQGIYGKNGMERVAKQDKRDMLSIEPDSKYPISSRTSHSDEVKDPDPEVRDKEETPVAGASFSIDYESVDGQVLITRAKTTNAADNYQEQSEPERNTTISYPIATLTSHDDPITDDNPSNSKPRDQSAKRKTRSHSRTSSLEDKESPESQEIGRRKIRRKETVDAPPPPPEYNIGSHNNLEKEKDSVVTFQISEGSSSPSPKPEIKTPYCSNRTRKIVSSVGIGNRVKEFKRKGSRPDRFGFGGNSNDDLEISKLEKSLDTDSSPPKDKGDQLTQTVKVDQDMWLLNMNDVFEEIKDYEIFFSRDDLGENWEDALKLLRETEFHQRKAKARLSKVISEGKVLIPELPDSHNIQAIQTFEDLKKKVKELKSIAQRRIDNLSDCYNSHELLVEIRDLKAFTEKILIDFTRKHAIEEHDLATTTTENQQKHQGLEKEVQWRQGRIEDIKRRAKVKPAVLEFGDCKNRLENVEIAWTNLERVVGNERKFFQFEKACEETSNLFEDAIFIANSEEYGDDVEETEALLENFQILMTNAAKWSVGLDDLAQDLIDEGYPNVEKIKRKTSNVRALSDKFQEIADVRLSVLKRVKKVHMFNKQADECLKFIEDKKKFILESANDFVVDLISLPFQIERHEKEEESFNKLVKDEIKRLIAKIDTMGNLFPEESQLIANRREKCFKLWREMQDMMIDRGKRLYQTRDLRIFFDKHVNVMNQISCWITEVNGIELCRNVDDARTSLATCQNYEKIINEYWNVIELRNEGDRLLDIDSLQSFKMELTEKMMTLKEKWDLLKTRCNETLDILQENLDAELKFEKLKERKRKHMTDLIVESVDKD